ncbi:MAG: type III-A CRISPR-associated protein Csm2, partial [Anaerovoracaceae bacterium]
IRNILTMVNDLKNLSKREGDSLSEEVQGKVQYLKMRLAYESGRESVVDEFVKCTKLMETLEGIKESKEKLSLFCEYVEALVAYHRYYGGKVR